MSHYTFAGTGRLRRRLRSMADALFATWAAPSFSTPAWVVATGAALLVIGSGIALAHAPPNSPGALEATAYHTTPGADDPRVVPVDALYELTVAAPLDRGPQGNRLDVGLSGDFTGPDGQLVHVTGFYYDTLADGESLWKLRLAPGVPGDWRVIWRLDDPTSGATATGETGFLAQPGGTGFLRRNPSNPLRLALSDGTPYAPLGFNDCLGTRATMQMDGGDRFGAFQGTVDTRQYLAAYGAAGFNLFRFSQDNCSPNLASADLATYDPATAAYFDWLLTHLRAAGFQVFYGLFGYLLPDNPTSPPPAQVRDFLDYSIDRWGALVDVWELQNERSASDDWVTAAADIVRARDPYGHLVTTSWQKPDLAAVDINAPHWYGSEGELEADHVTSSRAAGWTAAGKPVLVGEQGNSARPDYAWGNWLPDSAVRMRIRSWTAFFSEIGLVFWNNSWATNGSGGGASNLYIGPEERTYAQVLQWFTRQVDASDLAPGPTKLAGADAQAVRVYGLRSASRVAVYLQHFTSHSTATSDLTLTVDSPTPGRALWIDPASGVTVGEARVAAGRSDLAVPPFVVDLAFLTLPDGATTDPILVLSVDNPQADGDLDNDGQPDRGPQLPFGAAPLTLGLDAAASYDADGGTVTVTWDFGDGTAPAEGPQVSHTYAKGNFLLAVTVTDDEGEAARTERMVRVTADTRPDENDPPVLDAIAPVTGREGGLILISPVAMDREMDGGSYNRDGHNEEPIRLTAEDLPVGARFETVGSGAPELWWVPSFQQAGDYVLTFHAEDGSGTSAEPVQVRIRVEEAPEASLGPVPPPRGAPLYLPHVASDRT